MKTRFFFILLLCLSKGFYCSAQSDTSIPELPGASQEDFETAAVKPNHFDFITKNARRPEAVWQKQLF